MGVSSQGATGAAGGAVAGASAGAMLGGPWGAAIGGVVGGVSGLLSGNSAAKKQKKAMEEYNRQIRENAERNYQKIDIQEGEAAGDARDQLLDNNISMAQKRAQIESMAAATGTAGGTLGTLINDQLAEGGRNQGKIVDNYNREMTGYASQAEDIRRGAQAQLKSTSIQKPTAGEWLSLTASTATQMYSGVKEGAALNQELGPNYTLNGLISQMGQKSSGANTRVN